MALELESKALNEFTKVLDNHFTRRTYLYYLNNYLDWTNQTPDQAVSQDIKEIQTSLENYCTLLRDKEFSRAYLKLVFSSLSLFFGMNYKEVNKTRITKMIPPQEDKVGGIAYETEDIKKILEAIDKTAITKKGKQYPIKTKLRSRALVHFMAASGCRLGGTYDIKFKDLEKIENCYCVKVYSGSVYEYLTFLTPEASKALDEYLKTRDFESEPEYDRRDNLLTGRDKRIFFMSYEAMRLCLNRLVRRAKLQDHKEGKRYDKPLCHAFRKRFNTILKSNQEINPNLTELMLGHTETIPLDKHYLKPTKEKLFVEYRKGINDLTILKDNN